MMLATLSPAGLVGKEVLDLGISYLSREISTVVNLLNSKNNWLSVWRPVTGWLLGFYHNIKTEQLVPTRLFTSTELMVKHGTNILITQRIEHVLLSC